MNKLHLPTAAFLLLVVGCTLAPTPSASPPIQADVLATPTQLEMPSLTPTAAPHLVLGVLPPNTYGVVDNSTLTGKVIFGYQGWYFCPGDDSSINDWFHWFSGFQPDVDFWPDTSELTEGELCRTHLQDSLGNPLYAFSAYNPLTVMRHFKWMAEYGIDGVELQRFASELFDPVMKDARDQVLANVREGAETYGRVFYIQYDAVEEGRLERIKQDWESLVDDFQVTQSPQYLHHEGLPIVGLFGLGLTDRQISPEDSLDLIRFFQEHPEPKYRARVLGGVPFFWRTLDRDSRNDPLWTEVYTSLDILNPWAVGRIIDRSSADQSLAQTIKPDLEHARALGILYMPVIYPGFSWTNIYPDSPINQIPRNGGKFLWHQAFNLISSDVETIYVAMFDELDEGTSMFKMVETADGLPEGRVFVPLNIDGFDLPSDWYLILGGRISAMLKGELPVSPTIEDLPLIDLSELMALQLEFRSTSDWNTLNFLNMDDIHSIEIVSTTGEPTFAGVSGGVIDLTQTIDRANVGSEVTAWVEFLLDPSAESLDFELSKGHIGSVSLHFYVMEAGEERTVWEGSHSLNIDSVTGENLLRFSVTIDSEESG